MTVKATRTQELTQNTDETQNEKNASETTEEAEAVSQEEVQESLLQKFDFSEIDDMLAEIFPNKKLNVREVLGGLITGDLKLSFELIKQVIVDQFTFEMRNSRSGMIHILLLVIVSAIFTNFSSVFKSTQVAEISFSMLYMFLITIVLNNFRILVDAASVNLERLLEFMKLLGPVYFFAVALASGSSTSVMFYQLTLLLIFFVEMLILNFLIPVTQIYLMIRILSELSPQIHLTKFAELIETVVSWTLKTLLAGVVGLNVIQGLLSPAIDAVKRSIITKGTGAIPIIGDAISGTAEVVFGTAVLIRNGIGVVGMIVCLVICLTPLIQMAVTSLLYQVIAALIQPISDKRMVDCVSSIADGSKMLLRIVFTTAMLFLLTIAVVAATTGG
jgi:stage III sporulation protein AE